MEFADQTEQTGRQSPATLEVVVSRMDPLNDAETRALTRALWRDAAARCMLLRPRPDHGLQCLLISPAMLASLGLAGSEIANVDLDHLLSPAGRQQLDDVIRNDSGDRETVDELLREEARRMVTTLQARRMCDIVCDNDKGGRSLR